MIAALLAATFGVSSLFAGSAHVPYWDSGVSIVVSHLGTGTSADCTVTYYGTNGSVAATASHTFTAQNQTYTFSPPGSGNGNAYITCDEQALAHGFFGSGSAFFSIPIYAGLPF